MPGQVSPDLAPSPAGDLVDVNVSRFARRCRSLAARLPALDAPRRFRALMDLMREAPAECRTQHGRLIVAALVRELASRLMHESAREPRGEAATATSPEGLHATSRHVERALGVVGKRFTDSALTLTEVAASVGVSRWYLSRLLHRATGCGFLHLLAVIRIRSAKLLLIETSLSIKEIASRTGYEHVSHLDRQFRRLSGLTPRTYRSLWRSHA
jgi:transcriptional regulator GlxA family with amidase domain